MTDPNHTLDSRREQRTQEEAGQQFRQTYASYLALELARPLVLFQTMMLRNFADAILALAQSQERAIENNVEQNRQNQQSWGQDRQQQRN